MKFSPHGTYRQGALVRRSQPQPAPIERPQIDRPAHDEAFALASANRHKSWARRWLKLNGYRL